MKNLWLVSANVTKNHVDDKNKYRQNLLSELHARLVVIKFMLIIDNNFSFEICSQNESLMMSVDYKRIIIGYNIDDESYMDVWDWQIGWRVDRQLNGH